MAPLNVLLLLLLSFIATIHVVNGIDLEIGGAPYFGTVTSTTRLSFTVCGISLDIRTRCFQLLTPAMPCHAVPCHAMPCRAVDRAQQHGFVCYSVQSEWRTELCR